MRTKLIWLFIAVLPAILASCGKSDEPKDTTVSSIVGSWVTHIADPAESYAYDQYYVFKSDGSGHMLDQGKMTSFAYTYSNGNLHVTFSYNAGTADFTVAYAGDDQINITNSNGGTYLLSRLENDRYMDFSTASSVVGKWVIASRTVWSSGEIPTQFSGNSTASTDRITIGADGTFSYTLNGSFVGSGTYSYPEQSCTAITDAFDYNGSKRLYMFEFIPYSASRVKVVAVEFNEDGDSFTQNSNKNVFLCYLDE